MDTPKPRTDFELKWADSVKSGAVQARFDALQERRKLSLQEKIELSRERIREWYEAFGGKVAVSFSGGVDSTVLLWLARGLYPDVPAVFVNTGLEYPELVRFVRCHDNVTTLRPKVPFYQVIERYGWPIASKKVARGVNVLRHPTDKNQNIYGLYDRGVNRHGENVQGFQVPQRWRFLVDAPFETSDACCGVMKKAPMHRYERETGRAQFVGILTEDSKGRERSYMQAGCNAFDLKSPRSWPLAFWTEQDVLRCLKENAIPYASVYGDIVEHGDKLDCTGVRGTGCVFCLFGLHLDESPTRFQRLHDTHPRLWDYCMNRLGMADVLRHIRRNIDPHLAHKFNPLPCRAKCLRLPME